MTFRDRNDAGQRLADALNARLGPSAPGERRIVLALPRGGVPVAAPVARAIGAPLDVLVVRKLGVPGHEEYAIGAIASGGARFLDRSAAAAAGVPDRELERIERHERKALLARERRFLGDRPRPALHGATVILVDDGVATGSTLKAALQAVRANGPARIVVAVPVAPHEAVAELHELCDDVVCLEVPEDFYAVGQAYASFPQVSDAAVQAILAGSGGDATA